MAIVRSGLDQVEANAVTAAMRRAFKAGLEESDEWRGRIHAHGSHQCSKLRIEP
jgi:hypothetical protein